MRLKEKRPWRMGLITLLVVLFATNVKGAKYNLGYPVNVYGAEKLQLFLSTSELEDVPFSIDSLEGFNFSGVLSKNTSIVINIPKFLEVKYETDRYKGIIIRSNSDHHMSVFAQSYRIRSSGLFSALPCRAQNLKEYVYYVITWKESTLTPLVPQFLIVGCENDTTVTVGNGEAITLNEMETFLFSTGTSLTGMKVVSDKPISLISGHECANVPSEVAFCDYIIEQFPNTALWGNRFLTSPLQGRTAPDIYVIVPSLPLTNVTLFCSNTSSSTLTTISEFPNNHKVVTVTGRAYCSVESNHPIQLAQFASGEEADNTRSDPFMMNVLPIRHYSNDYSVVVPPEFPESVISIFILPEYFQPNKVLFDGESLEYHLWTGILCNNNAVKVCGYLTHINAGDGQHKIYHEDYSAKLAVSVYGFKYHDGYGYYDWQLERPSIKNEESVVVLTSPVTRSHPTPFITLSQRIHPTPSPNSVSSYRQLVVPNLFILFGAVMLIIGVTSCALLLWLLCIRMRASFLMIWQYKALLVGSTIATLFSFIMWIVYLIYVSSNDIHYERGTQDSLEEEGVIQDTSRFTMALLCFILSLLTSIVWLFAILFLRCGMKKEWDHVSSKSSSPKQILKCCLKWKRQTQESSSNTTNLPHPYEEVVILADKNDGIPGCKDKEFNTTQNVLYGAALSTLPPQSTNYEDVQVVERYSHGARHM